MAANTLMTHYVGSNLATNAARFSHNSIQGHAHSVLGVAYHADKSTLRWAMGTGCLMDPHSPAARYGANAVLKRPLLGLGMLLDGKNGNTLVISDMHIPYHHRDSFDFLWALHAHYNFSTILNVGDIVDHHAGSFHTSETDAHSAEKEYELTKVYLKELQQMFPKMVITLGNHDIIPARKAKESGLPTSMLSNYNAMYETDKGWSWVKEHFFDSKGATPVVIPMTLNAKGRWDKRILKVGK